MELQAPTIHSSDNIVTAKKTQLKPNMQENYLWTLTNIFFYEYSTAKTKSKMIMLNLVETIEAFWNGVNIMKSTSVS